MRTKESGSSTERKSKKKTTKPISRGSKSISKDSPNISESSKRIWEMERTSILQKAIDVTSAANRGHDYGHPLDNFEMEAELMNVWMHYKHAKEGKLGPILDWKDMAIHKLFMKITRECHRHKEDNSVDLAGYAWTLEEAFIEDKKRKGEIS